MIIIVNDFLKYKIHLKTDFNTMMCFNHTLHKSWVVECSHGSSPLLPGRKKTDDLVICTFLWLISIFMEHFAVDMKGICKNTLQDENTCKIKTKTSALIPENDIKSVSE